MINILIFGTSNGYIDIKSKIDYSKIDIIGFIDNNKYKQGNLLEGKTIYSTKDILNLKFDYILIASMYYEDIMDQLLSIGISLDRILPYYKYMSNHGLYKYNEILSTIFRNPLKHVVAADISLNRERRLEIYDTDYVRISSLELVSEEIYGKNIPGEVAELGVYKGEFSKYLNIIFRDRYLYLFDTFEGFNKYDMEYDIENDFIADSILKNVNNFEDTSVQLVLSKMSYPENCKVIKGYFPESLNGLEEKFAFVSIDTDLFLPTYEGLKYFYSRLSKGGYIFIHDYNCKGVNGVKEAVIKFCGENDISYFPLTDIYGSAVICK